MHLSFRCLGAVLLPGVLLSLHGAEISGPGATTHKLLKAPRSPLPDIAPASSEAENQIKRFKLPAGVHVDLWAAEPMLANPVAFAFDEQGRMFVSETHRYRSSVLDIRHYMFMLEDDMANRTVDDRVRTIHKYFGNQAKDLAKETEIVRLLEDRNGDGKADFSSVYADGFNTVLDGIASGVYARKGKVWFTNIPELWLLEGIDAKGHSLTRKSLSHGYGVRFSFTGHDMHGLNIGPDGLLYFSFGDRGAHVRTQEGGLLDYSDEGAVFRCDLDGSNMEVVHYGLRNPQELAFDDHGNLFTADNDCDNGDHERLVYIVEGADSGWRVGHQHAPLGKAGMWMMESWWTPRFADQTTYILPPLANLNDGPSGFTYYPGTGWGDAQKGHFFLCSFKGSAARSGIDTFTVEQKGASFELKNYTNFIGNVESPDVDFGPDGGLYFADWGEGWERTSKGRIYRASDPAQIHQPIVKETRRLIGEGMDHRSIDELMALLDHPDRRVRQEAQFSLVDKGGLAIRPFQSVLLNSKATLPRLHALWGLGMIARHDKATAESLLDYTRDADPEIRAHAARLLGDRGVKFASSRLVALLQDPSLRVRFFAVQSLGKIGNETHLKPIIALVRENADKDAYLRHVCVVALTKLANGFELGLAAKDSSPAVRMATLLAMRRQGSPRAAMFLQDPNKLIRSEAIRAINDAPLADAMPDLAKLADGDLSDLPMMYRILNANFRTGDEPSALRLGAVAAREDAPVAARVEALQALGTWAKPPQRDRVMGLYRPMDPRSPKFAAEALQDHLTALLADPVEDIVAGTAAAVASLGLTNSMETLAVALKNPAVPAKGRAALLAALGTMKAPQLASAVVTGLADSSDVLRQEASRWLASIDPKDALATVEKTLASGTVPQQQAVVSSLATIKSAGADTLLVATLDRLQAGQAPREIALEVMEAAAARDSSAVKRALAKYRTSIPPFAEALAGGNAAAGKKVFFEKAEASCLRCHKVNGEGGEAGPDLSHIASKVDRDYFLESIVNPAAKIAPGYESVSLDLKNGQVYGGILKSETDTELTILSPEDGLVTLAKDKIDKREGGISGMQAGIADLISRRELRDVIEYLTTLK
jgi:quinoprotein glucose dehydrogenase